MDPNEARRRVIAALLQAGEPRDAERLAAETRAPARELRTALEGLVREGLVLAGELLPGGPAVQYVWAARWKGEARRRAATGTEKLRASVAPDERTRGRSVDVESEAARAFCEHVLREYRPPPDKRLLVFVQCSVRRPFSSSPSHASIRRAIRLATGYDPRLDREACPVHVVVLASQIGPVPYDLEDVYPANVGGGGVKHFRPEYYERVKPLLAERMAQYVLTHRRCYDHIATFTEGRYGEVMEEARRIAVTRGGSAAGFRVLPRADGARNIRIGKATPRKYWEKYWIQLYLEILGWLPPAARKEAGARLKDEGVRYEAAENGR